MFNVENKTTQITEAVAVETVVRCTEIDVNGHLNNAKFVEYLEWVARSGTSLTASVTTTSRS
jgi:acyl-ACP thioesterase